MNTISASKLSRVLPGVQTAAGTLNQLASVILSTNANLPVGSTKSFSSALAVQNFFGPTSPEASMANIFFAGPVNATGLPSTLRFTQYNASAVAAQLQSASLATMTLAQLKALAGVLTVTVNGTVNTSSSISLSSATSFSNAATIIQAGFTSPNFTVSYSSQLQAFVFTSTATGSTATIGYASGTLAAPLFLTQTTGASAYNGADPATPAAFMTTLRSNDKSWQVAGLSFAPPNGITDLEAFSDWTSQQNGNVAFSAFDTDPNALIINPSTASWGNYLQTSQDSGSVPLFGDYTHVAFALSYASSIDFTQPNGRSTLAYRSAGALLPAANTDPQFDALIANGYNFYGVYANAISQFQNMQPGSVSGPYAWLDSYLDQMWMRTNLQTALITLMQNVGNIPYNNDGYAMVSAACQDPINAALNFGAIRAGVTLSSAQIAAVNQAAGKSIASAIQTQGYYLSVGPASPSTRVARQSPPITLWYTDGQSIQQLNMTATEIA